MPPVLRLPLPVTDVLQLADWLEILALISPDRNASYADLQATLRRESIFGPDSDETVERLLNDVSLELSSRAEAADTGYAFDVQPRGIYLRSTLEECLPYVFCLCLSVFDGTLNLNKKPYPRRLFEYISCHAAKNYIGGQVVRFASPRHPNDLPVGFNKAVGEVCIRIKEGNGFSNKHTSHMTVKDGGVDVIAWRDFPDQAPGKLLLFGNCASGRDWSDKLNELQPHTFVEEWMVEVPVSTHVSIKALFLPRRVNRSDWISVARRAGIIFDRCRITHWASKLGEVPHKDECLEWVNIVLR